MKGWVKITVSLFVTLLIVGAVIALLSYNSLNDPLPEYSGEMMVRGITGEVKIYRDDNAIPYIVTAEETDAAFGLGYLHAQERLFQMDVLRRAGTGTLSEVFGSRTVPVDRMFRTLDFSSVVDKSLPELNERSRAILEAYVDGVNLYIREAKGNYPTEFDVLGYDPEMWTTEHSLIISKMMAWSLNLSWWSDISFAHLINKLGVVKVRDVLPDYPENEPTIIPDDYKKLAGIKTGFLQTDKMFRDLFGFTGTHIGSNNWVVNGNRSLSGKPVIANDPHLPLQAPATWYVVVIRANGWNCDGFTLPGAPGIVIGKNENISWVVTNVMADDADFYMEKLDSSKAKYMLDGQWRDLAVKRDTIIVKDSASVEVIVRRTHRGPIISDVHLYSSVYPNQYQQGNDISMRWTGFDVSDELFGVYSINRADDWNEFKEGLRYFQTPGQNFVYADKEGNIGYVCAAKLPERIKGSPTLIFDGTTSRYDWNGYVPYEAMPKMFNPAQGFIASANNKTVKNFKHHISNIWEPPSRIKRITELLNNKEKHSAADFKNYQNDFYSHYAKEITPYILNAFDGIKIYDDNLQLSLELLRKWDFVMNSQSQVPAIYEVFFQQLLKNVFQDEMGEELFNEYIFLANVPYRTITRLLKENRSAWFDNITTGQIESRDDIIRESLSEALDKLSEMIGADLAMWQWGEIHKVTFRHLFHGYSSLIDKVIDVGPYSIGGSGTSLFLEEYSFAKPFDVVVGPSMRYIYDFNKPDQFQFILTTGQSGHFMSEYYDNMTSKWINGKYITINTNKNIIEQSGYNLLIMYPE